MPTDRSSWLMPVIKTTHGAGRVRGGGMPFLEIREPKGINNVRHTHYYFF